MTATAPGSKRYAAARVLIISPEPRTPTPRPATSITLSTIFAGSPTRRNSSPCSMRILSLSALSYGARCTLLHEPDVGLVQTPHHFFNKDPIQSNLLIGHVWPDEQRFFFDHVMPSKD